MQQLPLWLLILYLPVGSQCLAAEDIAGVNVGHGPSTSSFGGAKVDSDGRSGIGQKSGSGEHSSSDTTWSQGLTLGVNGPIPVIVVDQFGYPTKASKVAVIRNPQAGYDNAVHFTPGKIYA